MAFENVRTLSLDRVLELGDDMSLHDDIPVLKKEIDGKIGCDFIFDMVMEAFFCRIYKMTDDIEQGIGLRLDALRRFFMAFSETRRFERQI